MMSDFDTLADRIREEAAQASRAGQMARLEALADEVEALRRGGETLGDVIASLGQVALDATGMHDAIDKDGDGDWGAVWESVYDIRSKALREAADEADSIGHHWSGAPALAFFALASDLRARAAHPAPTSPATKET